MNKASDRESVSKTDGHENSWIIWSIILGVFYLPAFLFKYVIVDDISLWESAKNLSWRVFCRGMFDQGRPIFMVLNQVMFSIPKHLGDWSVLHFSGYLAGALFFYLIIRVLRETIAIKSKVAFLVAGMAATVPSLQVCMGWATTCNTIWGAPFGLLAGLLATRLGMSSLFGSLITMSLALAIYQSSAMVFWLPLALLLLMNKTVSMKVVLKTCLVFIAACILHYIAIRIIANWTGVLTDRFYLAANPLDKVRLFVIYLQSASNLPRLSLGAFTGLIQILLFSGILMKVLCGDIKEKAIRFLGIACVLVLTMTPTLTSVSSYYAYRQAVGLEVVCVVIAALALYQLINSRKWNAEVALGIICALWILCGAYNFQNYFIKPAANEFTLLTAQLKTPYNPVKEKGLWVVLPQENSGFRLGEYGSLTLTSQYQVKNNQMYLTGTAEAWVKTLWGLPMNGGDVPQMVLSDQIPSEKEGWRLVHLGSVFQ